LRPCKVLLEQFANCPKVSIHWGVYVFTNNIDEEYG